MSEWHPSRPTIDAIHRSEVRLADDFPLFLSLFDRAFQEQRTFGGPSLYFHFRCIATYADWPVERKLADERFLEHVYAVLASWGLHRMGDTAAKLRPFKEFTATIHSQRSALCELEHYTISGLSDHDLGAILGLSREILAGLRVSSSDAQFVAGTKVLHHVLPQLFPPMDRRYTLSFFGVNTMAPSQYSAASIFTYLYPSFVVVAKRRSEDIRTRITLLEENWHTSYTKVIDNAIVGSFKASAPLLPAA